MLLLDALGTSSATSSDKWVCIVVSGQMRCPGTTVCFERSETKRKRMEKGTEGKASHGINGIIMNRRLNSSGAICRCESHPNPRNPKKTRHHNFVGLMRPLISQLSLMLQCPNHSCIPNQSMCRCIFPGQSSGISIESLPRLNPHSCIPSSPLRLVSHAGDYGDQRRSKVGWWHHSERWDQGWHDSSRPRNFMQQNARPRNMRSMKEP